jgi:hypothetical protein
MEVVRCRLLAPVLANFYSTGMWHAIAIHANSHGHFNRRRSVSFQAPRGGPYFRDSSGLLFSMYSKLAEEEDNKMVDRWQKEAEGILIFVSFSAGILFTFTRLNWNSAGRLILCRRRYATFRDDPGLEAESSGELRILSQEHLSISLPSERLMSTSLPCRQCFHVLSYQFRHMGEFTLVFECTNQSHLRNVGDIHTKMGTSIHQDHAAVAVQSRQASTAPCILF